MSLPPFTASWISILLYFLLLLIVVLGIIQTVWKQFFKKTKFQLNSLLPLGLAALAFSVIGIIKSYMAAFQVADATAEVTKLFITTAIVHGTLEGGPYPILGLLCVGIGYIFKYINQ